MTVVKLDRYLNAPKRERMPPKGGECLPKEANATRRWRMPSKEGGGHSEERPKWYSFDIYVSK